MWGLSFLVVGIADTPAPTPAWSLRVPNPEILSLPAILDLLLPSKHLAFHFYSIICPLAPSSWFPMQILSPSCGYAKFKHWADTSGASVEGSRAELWGGFSDSLWLDCPLTCREYHRFLQLSLHKWFRASLWKHSWPPHQAGLGSPFLLKDLMFPFIISFTCFPFYFLAFPQSTSLFQYDRLWRKGIHLLNISVFSVHNIDPDT